MKYSKKMIKLHTELNDVESAITAARMLLSMGITIDRQGDSVEELLDEFTKHKECIETQIFSITLQN